MVDARVERYLPQLKRLSAELDRRVARAKRLEPYFDSTACDPMNGLPPAVTEGQLTKVYRYLMPVADAPWGSLIVGAKRDRLQVNGLRDQEAEDNAKAIWRVWQENQLDAENKLAHDASLLNGRSFGTVWPDGNGSATVTMDDSSSMIVEYTEGPRRERAAALRRWQDGETVYATLYRPDGIYKFVGNSSTGMGAVPDGEWTTRQVDGERWPLANPLAPNVPVAELAVNRRLKDWRFGFARGEFEHCVGLIDRINLLTFLGLVVAFWMGFPMRGVIGEKIRHRVLTDDTGSPLLDDDDKPRTEPIPILEARPDSIFQLTNPEAKLAQYEAADRSNLAVYDELDHLAMISSTPRHYFPMQGGMQNLSAEAITASEGGMYAAIDGHKASLGGGHLDIARLIGQAIGKPLSPLAQITWAAHEARSLAEKADAASKLKDGLPWPAVAEIVGLGSMDDINRWIGDAAQGPLSSIIAGMNEPPPVPAFANGNGGG